jgi:outer membrane lipoprotein carrier protein
MKHFLVLSLGLLLAFPVLAAAATDEKIALSEVIGALEGPFKENAPAAVAIHDFEAKLIQESNIVSLNRIQRAQGTVKVRFEPGPADQSPKALFRWQYVQPAPQEFVSDGQSLFAYLPENKQVIQSEIDPHGQSRSDDPISFLTGLGHLSRNFLIAWAEPNQDTEGNFILELSPRRESPLLKKLRVTVNRDTVIPSTKNNRTDDLFPLLSSTVFDPNGNTTIIEFNEVRVNRGIPISAFQFVIPEGVEVIHPSDNGL